jgi:hypothetical protein
MDDLPAVPSQSMIAKSTAIKYGTEDRPSREGSHVVAQGARWLHHVRNSRAQRRWEVAAPTVRSSHQIFDDRGDQGACGGRDNSSPMDRQVGMRVADVPKFCVSTGEAARDLNPRLIALQEPARSSSPGAKKRRPGTGPGFLEWVHQDDPHVATSVQIDPFEP